MNNHIDIYGTMYVDVDCEHCGMSESVEVDISQRDWLSDYDIDLTIDPRKIKEELINDGWEEIGGKFVCPDCADELKGELQ